MRGEDGGWDDALWPLHAGVALLDHVNPIGSVHGGVFATLLDSAAGCAVHSSLLAGTSYTGLDLSVKFLCAHPTSSCMIFRPAP